MVRVGAKCLALWMEGSSSVLTTSVLIRMLWDANK